jgi:hypothetical protein
LTPTSIQFFVSLPFEAIQGFLKRCSDRGVKIKWFGAKTPRGFTSVHSHWTYIEPQSLSRTNQTLSTLCDLRLPGTLVEEDCQLICDIIREEFSSSEP